MLPCKFTRLLELGPASGCTRLRCHGTHTKSNTFFFVMFDVRSRFAKNKDGSLVFVSLSLFFSKSYCCRLTFLRSNRFEVRTRSAYNGLLLCLVWHKLTHCCYFIRAQYEPLQTPTTVVSFNSLIGCSLFG